MLQTLNKLASRALEMINENVEKGESYDGTKFEYSTNNFVRPYDSKLVKKMGGVRNEGEGGLYEVIKSKGTGKLSLLIHGYKDFKEQVYPEVANDFLTVSGKMLRNLRAIDVSGNQFILGFPDPEQEQKAFWLQVSGVGRSRRLWKFLGLSDAQQKELSEKAAEWLAEDTEFQAVIAGNAQAIFK